MRWETIIGLYDNTFRPIEIFHREMHEMRAPGSREEDSIARALAASMSDTAFRPEPHYLLASNDEIYFGYSNAYEIKVYSPEGKPARAIRKDYKPVPVTAKDKERFEEYQRVEFLRFLPAQAEKVTEKALRLIQYPKFKPAYQGFALADDGWLFVIINSEGSERTVLDVFDGQGHYVSRTEAAIPSEGLRLKKGKAYAIATEDGYKSVKRFSYAVREN